MYLSSYHNLHEESMYKHPQRFLVISRHVTSVFIHTVDMFPLIKSEGGLQLLHEAEKTQSSG